MALSDDLLQTLGTREQQQAQSGASYTLPTAGVEQALRGPSANPAELRPLSRALAAVRGLQPTSTLDATLTGGANPPAVPPVDLPEGPPDKPSIPILGGALEGLGGALDFLAKVSLMPAYLGRYRDPGTGILYRWDDLAATRPTLGDIVPSLGGLETFFDPEARAARERSTQRFTQQYGLSPLDQMLQVFTYESAGEASSAARSPETRQAIALAQEALRLPASGTGSLAWGSVLTPAGKLIGDLVHKLTAGNPAVQEAEKQSPSFIEGYVGRLRDAYVTAGMDPTKYNELASVVDAFVSPDSVAVGALPLKSLAKVGVAQLARLPAVSWMGKQTVVRQLADLPGTIYRPVASRLLAKTPSGLAATAGRQVHDFLGFLNHEVGGVTGPGSQEGTLTFTQGLRRYLNDDDYAKTFSSYFTENPESEAAHKLLKQYQEPVEDQLRVLEMQGVSVDQVREFVGSFVESLERKRLYVPSSKASWTERVLRTYEKVEGAWGNYWRPLVLHTRPDYVVYNLGAGITTGLMRQGSAFFTKDAAIQRLERAGIMPALDYDPDAAINILDIMKLREVRSDQVDFAHQYIKEGFSPTGTSRQLPPALDKMPILGWVMRRIGKLSDMTEQTLHAKSFAAEYLKEQRSAFKAAVEELPPEQRVLGRYLTQGAVSDTEVLEHYKVLSGEKPLTLRDWLGSWGEVNPRVDSVLQAAYQRVLSVTPALSFNDLEEVFDETRRLLAQDAIIKKALLDPNFKADTIQEAVMKLHRGDAERAADKALSEALEAARRERDSVALAVNEELVTGPLGKASRSRTKIFSETVKQEMELNAARATNRLQGLYGQLRVIVGDYGQERQVIWDAFWKEHEAFMQRTHKQGHNLPKYGPEREKLDALYDAAWAKVTALIQKTGTREENAFNIYARAQYEGWDQARYMKELDDWLHKPGAYTLSDQIAKKVAEKIGHYRGTIVKPTGGMAPTVFQRIAQMAGYKDSEIAGIFPSESQLIDDVLAGDLEQLAGLRQQLDSVQGIFGSGGTALPSETLRVALPEAGAFDINAFTKNIRDKTYWSMDKARRAAESTQMNYLEDQRVIDRYMRLFFPFSFFNTRYMTFMVQQAIRDPRQAYHTLRVLKAWADQSEDKPFWQKWNVTVMTVGPGTPDEVQVQFNPMYMVYPMGTMLADVLSAANAETGESLTQGLAKLANFMGGTFHPFIIMPASLVGMSLEGGPPKSFGDVVKSLVPPETWARMGIAAVPGLEQYTLGALTERELNQVINQIRGDVALGKLAPDVGSRAAALLKERKPDAVGIDYLRRVSGGRFLNSVAQPIIPGSMTFKPLGQRSLDLAYEALNKAKTEAERSVIYQNNPGLQINLSSKEGDELKLALIHAKAPTNPILRSLYYQAKHQDIQVLLAAIHAKQGDEVPQWRLQSATPESYTAFRLAGGSAIQDDLTGWWSQGKPLPPHLQDRLAGLYKTHGMGSLSYTDWRDYVLPDAYRQWLVANNAALEKRGVGVQMDLRR